MAAGAYDAIIIGGGPGGSATATYLAKAGKRVLLLEKEIFPRFHIGESLLPYSRRLFEEMGVMEALKAERFPIKYGAQFFIGNGSKALKFVFREGIYTEETETFQVERAKFDHILLKHAALSGAEVREGFQVSGFTTSSTGVSIKAKNLENGSVCEFEAPFLVDASGRSNLTGNQEGVRVIHPRLKKLALFGHFTGVRLDEGEKRGDTLIVRLENKWFWIIPVSADKISVGCVMDQGEFAASRENPSEFFTRIWKSSLPLRERMEKAVLIGKMQTTSDFSYHNKRLIGDRLLRVGDAAGFMDPIFSAGVFLAMHSGKLAAQTILECLDHPKRRKGLFVKYERRVRDSMRFYWEMVEHFYTTPFLEVFFEPREKYHMASAVNAALAGHLEGGWKIRWRMRLFFWVVRAQARLKFLPEISFK